MSNRYVATSVAPATPLWLGNGALTQPTSSTVAVLPPSPLSAPITKFHAQSLPPPIEAPRGKITRACGILDRVCSSGERSLQRTDALIVEGHDFARAQYKRTAEAYGAPVACRPGADVDIGCRGRKQIPAPTIAAAANPETTTALRKSFVRMECPPWPLCPQREHSETTDLFPGSRICYPQLRSAYPHSFRRERPRARWRRSHQAVSEAPSWSRRIPVPCSRLPASS